MAPGSPANPVPIPVLPLIPAIPNPHRANADLSGGPISAFAIEIVWWRHTTALGWKIPGPIQVCCDRLGIVTPERHWQHHQNVAIGYGDIFTLFDQPEQQWLPWLGWLRRAHRGLL